VIGKGAWLLACSAALWARARDSSTDFWRSNSSYLVGDGGTVRRAWKKYRQSLPTASLGIGVSEKRNLVGLVGQSIEGLNRGREVFARQSRRTRVRQVILGRAKKVLNSLFIGIGNTCTLRSA
jgi:hypothetical protein